MGGRLYHCPEKRCIWQGIEIRGNGLLPLPILSGCDTIFLLEGSVEIGQVKETAAFCDGQDAVIGCDKKSGCDI